ncbi:MAG: FAD-dependent oxidoreductase [Armatimonadota bacterium]|nr:FAD-dependent oxidoreductase [Armatimonadota bacterium]
MHPTEWLSGEIAGNLAAFCLAHNVSPTQVRHAPALLAAFQAQLEDSGITTHWNEILTASKR